MKFGIVVGGAFLLLAGLLAYSMIPNFHTVPLQSAQMVVNPKPIPVSSASLSETPENVTLFPGKENELLVNLTVSTQSGVPSFQKGRSKAVCLMRNRGGASSTRLFQTLAFVSP